MAHRLIDPYSFVQAVIPKHDFDIAREYNLVDDAYADPVEFAVY
jgi:hypothetical protein